MSAIAGLVRLDGAALDRATVERMENLLVPCGPDARRHWFGAGVGLVHTLLRTTPEDLFDRQPLQDAASRDVLLFDGRIDNRDELARALAVPAAELAGLADSELVLRACLRWDVQALDRLIGDFAIAFWQPSRRRLWLARDPLGHRPLFWHRQEGFFAFASQPKALFAIPGVPRELCEQRLAEHLAMLPHRGPQSFFEGVFRVEPGSLLVLEDAQVRTHRHHRFDLEHTLALRRDDDYVEALREQLDRAVGCRLRSSGPVAAHLSSGFDSATVVAVAARLLAARNQPLIAYTAVPREGYAARVPRGRHADEGPGASALARRFPNIEHVLIRSGEATALSGLESRTQALDRPSFPPANMPWLDAIEHDAARRGVKVMMDGQVGNMTISYDGLPRLGALVGSGRWIEWWREASALRQAGGRRWRFIARQSFGPFIPRPLWMMVQSLRGQRPGLDGYSAINPRFAERMKVYERADAIGVDLAYRPWADGRRMRAGVLERQDQGEAFLRSHVNAGLDLRGPLADVRLIAFCLSVPDRQFLHRGQDRWLLRRAMAGVLPPEITESATKGLQAADWHESFAADLPRLRDELGRLAAHGAIGDYLDLDSLDEALAAWPDDGYQNPSVINTYRAKMLRGIAAGAFVRYVDDNNR